MPEKQWSFCRACAFHSAGKFDQCPACDSKDVKHVDLGVLLDAKTGDFYPGKEEAG